MTVDRLCVREVDLADADESVQDAAARMHSRNVGTLVVVNSRNQPLGIVTDRDLVVRVVAQNRSATDTTVGEVMSRDPRRVREGTPIEDALAVMRLGMIRRVLVVDSENQLVGLLSLDDVLELIGEEFRHICKLLDHEGPQSLAHA